VLRNEAHCLRWSDFVRCATVRAGELPGGAATQIEHLARLKSSWNPMTGVKLLEVLEETRGKLASRRQDKINGILGLLREEDRVALVPQPGQTDIELNERVTRLLLERHGFDFLLNDH